MACALQGSRKTVARELPDANLVLHFCAFPRASRNPKPFFNTLRARALKKFTGVLIGRRFFGVRRQRAGRRLIRPRGDAAFPCAESSRPQLHPSKARRQQSPLWRYIVVVRDTNLIDSHSIDGADLSRSRTPLKPGGGAPGILICYANQAVLDRVLMDVTQSGKVRSLEGKTCVPEIVPDRLAWDTAQGVQPFRRSFM